MIGKSAVYDYLGPQTHAIHNTVRNVLSVIPSKVVVVGDDDLERCCDRGQWRAGQRDDRRLSERGSTLGGREAQSFRLLKLIFQKELLVY